MGDRTERDAALDLAGRIRASHDKKKAQQKATEDARRAEKEELKLARQRVFEDLLAMVEASGVLEAEWGGLSFVLSMKQPSSRRGARKIYFQFPSPQAPGKPRKKDSYLDAIKRGWQEPEARMTIGFGGSSNFDKRMFAAYNPEIKRWALEIYPPESELPRRLSPTWKPKPKTYALFGLGMSWLMKHGLGLELEPEPDE